MSALSASLVGRPDDFSDGDDRKFARWFLNLQTAAVRTPIGYDTQDLELDIVVFPGGSHMLKDTEMVPDRVSEGPLFGSAGRVRPRLRRGSDRSARQGRPVVGHDLVRLAFASGLGDVATAERLGTLTHL